LRREQIEQPLGLRETMNRDRQHLAGPLQLRLMEGVQLARSAALWAVTNVDAASM
jgi:hypothetical protein